MKHCPNLLFNSIRAAAEKSDYDVLIYRVGDKDETD
jgi:hypothetical protein